MSEVSTWSLWNWLLLTVNFAVPLLTLEKMNRRDALKTMTTLKAFLAFSSAVALVVPIVCIVLGVSRPAYRALETGIEMVANLMICAIAWQLTRTVLPSLKTFIGVWGASLFMVILITDFSHLPITSTLVFWKLTLISNAATGAVLAVCALIPLSYWRWEYGFVALGLIVLIAGNAVTLVVASYHYNLEWLARWFPAIRVLLPSLTLASNILFLTASFPPAVAGAKRLSEYS